MGVPIHYLNVYRRPAQGSDFLNRYAAYNYQHTISAQGWFDTASCDIAVSSQYEGWSALANFIGARVAIYVDDPLVPIWEGLINRLILNAGTAAYTVSLDEMANRVSVVYTGAANAAAEVAPANNTVSQALYGIKQDQIEFGSDPSAATQRTLLQQTILNQRAFPLTSNTQAQGETNIVHLEMIGIFHTLEWEKVFSGLSAATIAFSTRITNQVTTIANGTTFFNNADTSQISTNLATTPTQQRAVSFWETFLKIAESGDATNYWVVGILPTNPNTKTRRLYYKLANTAIEYIAYQKDGLMPRNIWGKPIAPWLVVPDRGIRVSDFVTNFGIAYNDARVTYIQNIQYDANSQQVTWFGTDDTTARAAFQLRRSFKPLSKNMPNTAPTRVIVT